MQEGKNMGIMITLKKPTAESLLTPEQDSLDPIPLVCAWP
jgi:hypothetical protein